MKILIAGSGHIGNAIGQILSQSHMGYTVIMADLNPQPPPELHLHENLRYVCLDINHTQEVAAVVNQYQIQAIVSSLPFFLNTTIAQLAKSLKLHYFDLTEDISTSVAVAQIAHQADTAFIPHCGVAPGFINIVAHNLMQQFSKLDTVKLRCGALPQQSDHALQYAFTWSIDGLINEYINPCVVIANRQIIELPPLTDLETVQFDGAIYEAFNTSGGLGTLAENYAGKVNFLNYKSLRYPGHCEKMQFLMSELRLSKNREVLKKILLEAMPRTYQDVVLVSVIAQGFMNNAELTQIGYFKKFYPGIVNNQPLTAIQMTTASSTCVIVDIVLQNPSQYRGFIHQSQFDLNEFLNNRFAKYFQKE